MEKVQDNLSSRVDADFVTRDILNTKIRELQNGLTMDFLSHEEFKNVMLRTNAKIKETLDN